MTGVCSRVLDGCREVDISMVCMVSILMGVNGCIDGVGYGFTQYDGWIDIHTGVDPQ